MIMPDYTGLFDGNDALIVSAREPWTDEREAELRAMYPDYTIVRCGCVVTGTPCTCRIDLNGSGHD
jgi:hypothetical protein